MTTVFTFADVEQHKGKGDCWLVIGGKVISLLSSCFHLANL